MTILKPPRRKKHLIPEDIGDGLGLADLETGEAPNEPYKPQTI